MAYVDGTDNGEVIDSADGVTDSQDVIYGFGGNDTIYGLGGFDVINGGAGFDDIDGGDGFDLVSFHNSPTAVAVSLINGGNGGDANGDTYVNVERIEGSPFNDFLSGDDFENQLMGSGGNDKLLGHGSADFLSAGAGDDTLEGGAGDDTASGHDGADSISGDAGNDYIEGDAGNDTILAGDGDDELGGGGGVDSIDGGAGTDRVILDPSWAVGLVVNLTNGTVSDGDVLVGIENVFATIHDDTIIGDGSANVFNGSNGNDGLIGGGGADNLIGDYGDDYLSGGMGADTLRGDDGKDVAAYVSSTSGVIVNLDLGTSSGGDADGDIFSGIEGLVGSNFNDRLTGFAAGGNVLNGMGGNDTLIGGVGADTLNGAVGSDSVSYGASNKAVVVNLATGDAVGGHARSDTLTQIENVIGSLFADLLSGNTENNILLGGSGVDLLAGRSGNDILSGGAGADEIYGGAGSDYCTYASSQLAVQVNLATGAALGGDANGDTLEGIENLIGSALNDSLTGDETANVLYGEVGNDTLYGSAGTDMLRGGLGADWLNGGTGSDRIVYTGLGDSGSGRDSIFGFGDTQDKIDVSVIDAKTGVAGNQDFTFDNSFGIGDIRASVFGTHTLLGFNTDADAAAEMAILVTNINPATFSQADFIV